MAPALTIIIPTYKRPIGLEKTLTSVDRYRPPDAEVIVVDQSPGSGEHARHIHGRFPYVHYIHCSQPNLPAARNAGIKNSSGAIIFFTDDDAVLDPACLGEHLAMHEQHDLYAVAGRIKQMKEISWANTSVVAEVNRETGEALGNFDLDYEGEVLYASGGHFSIKRELLEAVGLFNPLFKGNALFEDVEFFNRVRKKGFTVTYNPRAVIYHYPEDSGGCHEAEGSAYLTDRLYNHTLYYLLTIGVIPSRPFILYVKNLIEYISRNPHNGHNPLRILSCMLSIVSAYKNALVSTITVPKWPL